MSTNDRKRIVVCADDFGLTAAASRSIAMLAGMGAISAVSCVVDGDYCRSHADALLQTQAISLGLHFNLTAPLPSKLNASLRTWLLRCFVLRTIDRDVIAVEFSRQLDRFENIFAAQPQFIDGHEHVHQFPGIREAVLDVLLNRYGDKVAVRSTTTQVSRGLKATTIAGLGGRTMAAKIIQRRLHANNDFAGVYNFTDEIPHRTRMQQWLHSLADGGLVMCHPELPHAQSAIDDARVAEHRFFSSDAWMQLRAACRVSLIPFARTAMQ